MASLKRVMQYFPDSVQKLWMFYCSLSSGNKSGIWLANGILLGSIYGTMDRLEKEAETKPEYLEVIEYEVPRGQMKEFEKMWNDSAKRCQTQRSYGWTRMYKAVAWDASPFQYLSTRLWEEKPVSDPIFERRLAEAKIDNIKRQEYVTVVDDSVVRTIS